MYAGTRQVLPPRSDNPRPNLLHVCFHTLFVIKFFLVLVLRFRSAWKAVAGTTGTRFKRTRLPGLRCRRQTRASTRCMPQAYSKTASPWGAGCGSWQSRITPAKRRSVYRFAATWTYSPLIGNWPVPKKTCRLPLDFRRCRSARPEGRDLSADLQLRSSAGKAAGCESLCWPTRSFENNTVAQAVAPEFGHRRDGRRGRRSPVDGGD